jgi:hypothetical protein
VLVFIVYHLSPQIIEHKNKQKYERKKRRKKKKKTTTHADENLGPGLR